MWIVAAAPNRCWSWQTTIELSDSWNLPPAWSATLPLYSGSPLSQTCLGRGAGGEGPSTHICIGSSYEFEREVEATTGSRSRADCFCARSKSASERVRQSEVGRIKERSDAAPAIG